MKITRWKLMVTKLKAKFIPTNYELELFKRLHNLKQKDTFVKDYIEKFYKLTIRSGHRELSKEKVAQYVNCLRFNIQDEVGMMKIESVEEAYQYALQVEDKLKRKIQSNTKGKEKLDKPSAAKDEPKHVEQKKRIGRGEFKGKCYKFCVEGHRSFQFSQRDCGRKVAMVNEMENSSIEPKQGES